jgi:low temperature requirement protein LtrA
VRVSAGARTPRSPRLDDIIGELEHRDATWLELFFDLVFVVAVAQLSLELVADTTATGFLHFILLFVPVWWAWVGFAFYATRFEYDDPLHRVLWLTAMLASAAMAVNIHEGFGSHAVAFAVSYAAVRTVLVVLYALARRRLPQSSDVARFLIVGYMLGAALWYASAFVDEPTRWYVWGLAMAIEALTPIAGNRTIGRGRVDPWHLPERFGLFMIIVLGESVAGVVAGVADVDWHVSTAFVAAFGFVAAASLWWSYFDFVQWSGRFGLLSSERSGALARDIYSYGHFPVAVGLTLLGAGTELAIVQTQEGSLDQSARWILCGGVALYLIAVSLIYSGMTRTWRAALWWPRLAVAALAVALAIAGEELKPVGLAGLLAAALIVHVVLETRTSQELSPPSDGPFGGVRVPAAFARAMMGQ